MTRPVPQTITCPNCGQPFSAMLEQILDTRRDPTAKERLLSGRVNVIVCPHCGYRGMVSTPLMYHDPAKQMAIVYVPMELNLQQADRERLIGDMTNAVMRSMPEDAPKGYLLQPSTALTLQGLVDQVLEADGITREMVEAERQKARLIDRLAEARADEVDQILEENQHLIDLGFLELLTVVAQAARRADDSRTALRLLNIRSRLMETTEAGRELRAREQALIEASQELQALGDSITREQFVDLLVKAAGDISKVDALGILGRVLLDYSTFQALSERIDATQDEDERKRLIEVRERLLAIAAEYEKQSRAIVERSVNTLRMLLQASDIRTAIQSNLDRIDETFLMVLQANLEEARRSGNIEASSRLRQIRDEVMRLIQESSPPEIRLINDLLALESEEEALNLLYERSSDLTPETLEMMEDLIGQFREAGNDPVADRLQVIRSEAEKMLTA